ncbi:PadR family transcriptional regulator [Cryobacterium cryoconiti]|uniref:PadR family transcriptional regulator n=1 Tax=Cryobacterium cryoconiti TaxID=1259239 RepID=A0A4Y8JY87_9MICO|nr:PadR family transcriptional regulator [Cryobacterium cryoconiti]TFD27555.1 PadR family transcriptional regulator [Cryobacterium cryoconiti]
MTLKMALLGILDLTPMTGYDLKKSIEASVAHFWSADQSQIYRTLAALVTDGLAEALVIPQEGRPDRREHHITPAGRASLAEWLRSPLEPETPHDTFLMRLFFVGALGIPATRAVLDARHSQATALLAGLHSVIEQEQARREAGHRAEDDLGHGLRLATLRNGILHAEAELAWLTETTEALA